MPNRLAQETSPYLQQHAHNPVDWYAWNGATLRLAREQDKLILFPVGYPACHWCHVMAQKPLEEPRRHSNENTVHQQQGGSRKTA